MFRILFNSVFSFFLILFATFTNAEVTFKGSAGVGSILNSCNSCHVPHGGSYNYSFASSEIGSTTLVNSILNRVNRNVSDAGFMPPGGAKLSASSLDILQAWSTNKLEQAPPQVVTSIANNILSYSANLTAQVQENGVETNFQIKYWQQNTAEPNTCPSDNSSLLGCTNIATGDGSGGDGIFYGISSKADDLTCDTTYSYRAFSISNPAAYGKINASNIETFKTNVCTAISIISTPVDKGYKDNFYSYDVDIDFSEKDILFSLEDAPIGMEIDSATGFVQWLPTELGGFDVTVKAEEIGGSGVTTQTYSIEIFDKPVTSAQEKIPFVFEPFSNSLKPNLFLTFDKELINDYLGVGWKLHGLPKIARCLGTRDIYGSTNSIETWHTDNLCFDDQALIDISGNYSDEGGVIYTVNGRPDIDRIESYAEEFEGPYLPYSAGRGPAYFKVFFVDGSIMELGKYYEPAYDAFGGQFSAKGPASRFEAYYNQDIVMHWSVSRYISPSGEEYRVSYFEDNINGEQYPIRIDYTANENTAESPNYAIELNYEDRHDKLTHYSGGNKISITKRIGKIKLLFNGILLYEYQLIYDKAPDNERSRLTKIDKCDFNDNCELFANINWQNGNVDFSYRLNYQSLFASRQNSNNVEIFKTFAFDFDNDGKEEVLRLFRQQSTYYWERYSFVNGLWQVESLGSLPTNINVENIIIVDLDGDGVYHIYINDSNTSETTHKAYAFNQDGSITPVFSPSSNSYYELERIKIYNTSSYDITTILNYDQTIIGDFTGDGIDDLFLCDEDELLTTDGFSEIVKIEFGNICDDYTQFGDLNGDSLEDLLSYDFGSLIDYSVQLNEGEISNKLFGISSRVSWDLDDDKVNIEFINKELAFSEEGGRRICMDCLIDLNYDGIDDLLLNSNSKSNSELSFLSFGGFRMNDPLTESIYYTNIFNQGYFFSWGSESENVDYVASPMKLDFNNDGLFEILDNDGYMVSNNGHNETFLINNIFDDIFLLTGIQIIPWDLEERVSKMDSNGDGAEEFLIEWIHIMPHIHGVTDFMPKKDTVASMTGNGYLLGLDNEDFDADGLLNHQEFEFGTNPENPDTDGDGTLDGEEFVNGSNFFDNELPEISILTDITNASFVKGEDFIITASALDPEEGDISNSIEWSSSIDGELTIGNEFNVNTLSVGDHELTLIVRDKTGASFATNVDLTITGSEDAETGTETGGGLITFYMLLLLLIKLIWIQLNRRNENRIYFRE